MRLYWIWIILSRLELVGLEGSRFGSTRLA